MRSFGGRRSEHTRPADKGCSRLAALRTHRPRPPTQPGAVVAALPAEAGVQPSAERGFRIQMPRDHSDDACQRKGCPERNVSQKRPIALAHPYPIPRGRDDKPHDQHPSAQGKPDPLDRLEDARVRSHGSFSLPRTGDERKENADGFQPEEGGRGKGKHRGRSGLASSSG